MGKIFVHHGSPARPPTWPVGGMVAWKPAPPLPFRTMPYVVPEDRRTDRSLLLLAVAGLALIAGLAWLIVALWPLIEATAVLLVVALAWWVVRDGLRFVFTHIL